MIVSVGAQGRVQSTTNRNGLPHAAPVSVALTEQQLENAESSENMRVALLPFLRQTPRALPALAVVTAQIPNGSASGTPGAPVPKAKPIVLALLTGYTVMLGLSMGIEAFLPKALVGGLGPDRILLRYRQEASANVRHQEK